MPKVPKVKETKMVVFTCFEPVFICLKLDFLYYLINQTFFNIFASINKIKNVNYFIIQVIRKVFESWITKMKSYRKKQMK